MDDYIDCPYCRSASPAEEVHAEGGRCPVCGKANYELDGYMGHLGRRTAGEGGLDDLTQRKALNLVREWMHGRYGDEDSKNPLAPSGQHAYESGSGLKLHPSWTGTWQHPFTGEMMDSDEGPSPAILHEGVHGWADDASFDEDLTGRLRDIGVGVGNWYGNVLTLHPHQPMTWPKQGHRLAGDGMSWEDTMNHIDQALAAGDPQPEHHPDGRRHWPTDWDARTAPISELYEAYFESDHGGMNEGVHNEHAWEELKRRHESGGDPDPDLPNWYREHSGVPEDDDDHRLGRAARTAACQECGGDVLPNGGSWYHVDGPADHYAEPDQDDEDNDEYGQGQDPARGMDEYKQRLEMQGARHPGLDFADMIRLAGDGMSWEDTIKHIDQVLAEGEPKDRSDYSTDYYHDGHNEYGVDGGERDDPYDHRQSWDDAPPRPDHDWQQTPGYHIEQHLKAKDGRHALVEEDENRGGWTWQHFDGDPFGATLYSNAWGNVPTREQAFQAGDEALAHANPEAHTWSDMRHHGHDPMDQDDPLTYEGDPEFANIHHPNYRQYMEQRGLQPRSASERGSTMNGMRTAAINFLADQNTSDRGELLFRAHRHASDRTGQMPVPVAQRVVQGFVSAVNREIAATPRPRRQATRRTAATMPDFPDGLMFQ